MGPRVAQAPAIRPPGTRRPSEPHRVAADRLGRLVAAFTDNEHRLARELAAVRLLLHLTLGLLHEHLCQFNRLREQHDRLKHEYRRLREAILPDEGQHHHD